MSDWPEYLEQSESEDEKQKIRMHPRTERPLGSTNFVELLEALTRKSLKPHKPGPKTD